MRFTIPKPCHADWNTMSANEKGRFCSLCTHDVIDLAQLSEEKAKEVLSQDNVCAKVSYNKSGHIHTQQGFSSVLILGGLLACNNGEDPSKIPEQQNNTTTQTLVTPDKDPSTEETITIGKIEVHDHVESSANDSNDENNTTEEDCDPPKKEERPPKIRMGRVAAPKEPTSPPVFPKPKK